MRVALAIAVILAALCVSTAAANPPQLISVGYQGLHPTATFSVPNAAEAFVFVSDSPTRAADDSFFTLDVKAEGSLTTSEIQAGTWVDADALNPGNYYVIVQALPEASCFASENIDPSCADGYSNVLDLTIPAPPIRYVVGANFQRLIGKVRLRLSATPLGDSQPYKVCYAPKTGRRRCQTSTLEGSDWSEATPTTDSVTASSAGLAAKTTFTWYVGGKAIGSKRVAT